MEYGDWLSRLYPEVEDHKVKTLTFQVTDKCNLACTYCYQINKGIRKMSFETAKTFIDKMLYKTDESVNKWFEDADGIIIEFIGGEPFLEIDLIDQIVDYFKEKAIELDHPWAKKHAISICSNGVLYTEEKVQRFLQKNAAHISFSVTVDGTKELHDSCRVFPDGSPSYELAHYAALDWMKRGYDMGSKITIAPGNINYVAICLEQMLKDGYTKINANTVFEKGWETEHATELYRQCKMFSDMLEANGIDKQSIYVSLLDDEYVGFPETEQENKNWCGTTSHMLAIDPDGRLFTCIRFMESSLGTDAEPYTVGTVKDGIATTPEEQQRLKCLACITRRSQSDDQCFYCPIATGCAHCTAYNYQETGTPDKKVTYSCVMHKARVLAICYYWNTFFRDNGIDDVIDLWVPEKWAVPIIGAEEYKNLVSLTESLGGYVNKDATQVRCEQSNLRRERFKEQEYNVKTISVE